MKKYLLAIGLLIASSCALASTVYVETATGTGVDSPSLESVTELTKVAVSENTKFTLTEKKSSADFNIETKLLKLGDAIILTMTKTGKDKKSFTAKLKASGLEDVDVVTSRLVRSVLTEVAPEGKATVTDVTESEQHAGSRRYEATRQWQFGFGPAWSSNLNVGSGGTNWSLGYAWGLDPDFQLALVADWYSVANSDDANFTDVSFGLDYYFSREKISPFIGADIGRGAAAAAQGCADTWVCVSDDDASGWVVGVTAGYKFFRTSSVNLGIVGRYKYLFDKTSYGNPDMGSVRLVVYY
ncbi:MAG: hypothetical protein KDD38_00110 [Bdellovibrionales bacterium]|nr:hypothetical protein [Bdellovibrionales bacterium]